MSTADRDDLLSSATAAAHTTMEMEMGPTGADAAASRRQSERLMSVTDQLSDDQRRLEDSHRVALETETLGAGILRDLRGQRDVLEHTRDHVSLSTLFSGSFHELMFSLQLYQADGSIDRASNTLHKMVRRSVPLLL